MTTITVEIEKDQDLQAVEAALNNLGLKYHKDDADNWGDLSEAEIEGIKAGLADIEPGRVHTHEEVMAHMAKKMDQLRAKHG